MSPEVAARHFGVSRGTIYYALYKEEIPFFRIGGLYRIRPEDVPQRIVTRWKRPRNDARRALWPKGPIIYFLAGAPGFVKIGFTCNMEARAGRLQVGCPVQIKLLAHAVGGRELEREYHERFAAHRTYGEWFERVPEIEQEIERLKEGEQ